MNPQPSARIVEASERGMQDRVFDFIERSGFGAGVQVRRIDTHASVVFLGGDRALKIKRAVRLPFLDYSTLEKRKSACEEELRVNASDAPEVYRRVIAITRRADDGFEVNGTGMPAEWAVEMLRFDEEQTLDRIAQTQRIAAPLSSGLADAILRAHHGAQRADGDGWLASIPGIIDRNTAKFSGVRGLDPAAIARLAANSCDHLAKLRTLLERRAGQGFVRRCHGDLHLANIALVNGRPVLFDAIEFDPVIATTDVLYDLAFTLMDLIHFGDSAASNAVFNHYLACTSDENLDGLAALPLFLSIRAAIRAHVLFTKSEQKADTEPVWQEAKRYFDLAGNLIVPKPAMLVAIGGRSGTGKSVLARTLTGLVEPPPGAVIVRSDVIRKHLFDVSETTPLDAAAYQPETSHRVYDLLWSVAERFLAQGCSVVVDAVFLEQVQRDPLAGLARRHGGRFAGLFLTADLPTRLSRIERREHDASDATPDVALKQEAAALGALDWHLVDASGTPEDTLRRSIAFLSAAGCLSDASR